ncbi:MAG: hypothetical protein CM15mP86_01740 [Gammaproteobacteria bacterium]|nr:MAG: hypothetical protein CM15mP86_01740 [Gammaproteobacteria bacterium]
MKCPKSIDFEEELPRHPTGKLYKRLLKDRYWEKKTTLYSIVAGSTGLVGSELVKGKFVSLGHVVTALTRRKTIPTLEQVEYKFVDYEKPSSFEHLFQNKNTYLYV